MNAVAAQPSSAQKKAGNYPKHHVNVRGLRISIENPAGSVRSGADPDGNEWSQELKNHYGYIRGTQGRDKDHVDVFLGPEPHNGAHAVYVVNQVDSDGNFDEHKVMLGFPDKNSAVEAYHTNYEEGWRGADSVATMAFPKFRQWVTSGRKMGEAKDLGKVEAKSAEERPKFASGGSLTPLTNLGGYMYSEPPRTARPNPLSMAGTAELIGMPGSDLGGSSGQNSTGSGAPGSGTIGGLSPGTVASGLSIAGQLSGTPELGMAGGMLGSAHAASQGQYGPVGGFVGGLMAGPAGGFVGGMLGNYASGALSGRSVANAVLGAAVPGYGLANGLMGGKLGEGLFGRDGAWNSRGVHTQSVPGIFGDWGLSAGTTAVNAANRDAALTGKDPMDALMDATGAFGTAPGPNNSGAVPGGPEDNAPGFGGATSGGGFSDVGGLGAAAAADAAEGGYLKRGGRVLRRYADGGSTGASFGVFPQLQRRKPQNNDRAAAANAPLSAVRGWAAGTLGLPGDIEVLLRMGARAIADDDSYIGRNMRPEPQLPTSEFYNDWLPGRAEGAVNRFAEGAGNLFGGAGATTVVRPIAKAAPIVRQGALRAMENAMQPATLSRQAGVVKAPGGNWSDTPGFAIEAQLARIDRGNAAGAWGDGPLTKYIRKDFGTAQDPLRAQSLRDEGAFANNRLLENYLDNGQHWAREELGAHHALSGGQQPRAYDNFVRDAIMPRNPSEEIRELIEYSSVPEARKLSELPLDEVPKSARWLDTAPSDTKIWGANTDLFDEFSHVFDYVDAATRAGETKKLFGQGALEAMARTNPTPQLLEDLELIRRGLDVDPAKLNALDVPTASLRTAEWDKYLQGAKLTEDLNKGIKSVLKTYPETGHQWVELAPEGLKAEGQAMKHCVGGYCKSVEDGSTRIISLRDKSGKPAVTVEVFQPKYEDVVGKMSSKQHDKMTETLGAPAYIVDSSRVMEYVVQTHPELLQPTVKQIKGPANRAPSKEVLPMVQDFIRGTDIPGLETFSDIRDLQNTGLMKMRGGKTNVKDHINERSYAMDVPAGYFTSAELSQMAQKLGASKRGADTHFGNYEDF